MFFIIVLLETLIVRIRHNFKFIRSSSNIEEYDVKKLSSLIQLEKTWQINSAGRQVRPFENKNRSFSYCWLSH